MNSLRETDTGTIELNQEALCSLANSVARELIRLYQDNNDMRGVRKTTEAEGQKKAKELETKLRNVLSVQLPTFDPAKLSVSAIPDRAGATYYTIGIFVGYNSYEDINFALMQLKSGNMCLDFGGKLSDDLRFSNNTKEIGSKTTTIDFSTQIDVDGLTIFRPRTEGDLEKEAIERESIAKKRTDEAERQRKIRDGELRPDTISEPLTSVIGRWVKDKFKSVFGAKE